MRQSLNIGDYRYIVDFFDAKKDLKSEAHYKKYVMLRHSGITNNIADDYDIYFIEKDLFTELQDSVTEDDIKTDIIAFPYTGSSSVSFSNAFTMFDSNLTFDSIKEGYDAYKLAYIKDIIAGSDGTQYISGSEDDLEDAEILCDKIRIYHPVSKKLLSAVVHVYSIINNVRFHFYCRTLDSMLSDYGTCSETEFIVENEKYSEYIEFYIPNISDLFNLDEDDNTTVYFNEDLNIVHSQSNESFLRRSIVYSIDNPYSDPDDYFEDDNDDLIYSNDEHQWMPLYMLIQPSREVQETDAEGNPVFVKQYLKVFKGIENNYLSYPVNILIYPYSEISNDSVYLEDSSLEMNEDSFVTKNRFSISSHLGFTDGKISIINEFSWPEGKKFVSDEKGSAVLKAYKYYNNIDEKTAILYDPSSASYKARLDILYKGIDDMDIKSFTEDDKQQVIDFMKNASRSEVEDLFTSKDSSLYAAYNVFADAMDEEHSDILTVYDAKDKLENADDEQLFEIYKAMKKNAVREEIEEEQDTDLSFLGFKIIIASDFNFKNKIYNHNNIIEFDELDDFAFNINGILSSWNELPDKLIVQVKFIDRILGNVMAGNYVIITKEWFKYIVTGYEDINKQKQLFSLNKRFTDNMDIIDLDGENVKVNFLNNMTCIIEKKEESSSVPSSKQSSHILYKPVFYRVNDLQNLRIRKRMVQNIGINLSEYMTKVETFKLIIDGTEYIEYGRNDIYVIFRIDASTLSSDSGEYDIVNEDDEYVSTGSFMTY